MGKPYTGKYCVYKTTHPKGFYYLGKGKSDLVRRGTYKGSGTRLKAAWEAGYPKSEWTSVILEEFDTSDEAFDRERELVTWDQLMDPFCLNTHIGGRGWRFGRLTSEQLARRSAKLRAASTGRKLTPAAKAKLSAHAKKQDLSLQVEKMRAANTGKKLTPERVEKIKRANTGQKRTDETKKKQSERQLAHAKLTCQHCNFSCRPATFARWHGEKCRFRS